MAITNFAELKAAISSWTARSDLTTAYLEEFIDLAETWLKREPADPDASEVGGIRSNITRATGNLSGATLALPSDFLEMYRLTITESGSYTTLRYLSPTELSIYHQSGTGLPQFFTISDVIEFDIEPDSTYAYELSYYPSVPALSDSQTTNWVITNYPDVYLAATMFHASRFLQDDKASTNWLQQYKASAYSASQTYLTGRSSQGSIAIKTDSSTP